MPSLSTGVNRLLPKRRPPWKTRLTTSKTISIVASELTFRTVLQKVSKRNGTLNLCRV